MRNQEAFPPFMHISERFPTRARIHSLRPQPASQRAAQLSPGLSNRLEPAERRTLHHSSPFGQDAAGAAPRATRVAPSEASREVALSRIRKETARPGVFTLDPDPEQTVSNGLPEGLHLGSGFRPTFRPWIRMCVGPLDAAGTEAMSLIAAAYSHARQKGESGEPRRRRRAAKDQREASPVSRGGGGP